MKRTLYNDEHEAFRSAFRAFLEREAVPHVEAWEAEGFVDRAFFTKAAAQGFLGFEAPEEFGGLGIRDFRYNAVMTEEVVAAGIAGDTFTMHNDIMAPYMVDLLDDKAKQRWLRGFTDGSYVMALAMTEPGAGSDLSAITTRGERDGDQLVINGSKTFITNGATCDLAIVLVRTGENDGRGTSLVMVERGTTGFESGRPMHKIGRRGQDTAELFFQDCRVPLDHIVGEPGRGLQSILGFLPRERLSLGVLGVAVAEKALALAIEHTAQRRAYGKPLIDLQTVRFQLAEMSTEIAIARTYVDRCVAALDEGDLSAVEAAGAKYYATDLQCKVVDQCLQLFGGYGFMEEYPLARMWRDGRVQRIYGGANEVMKDIVGRDIARRAMP